MRGDFVAQLGLDLVVELFGEGTPRGTFIADAYSTLYFWTICTSFINPSRFFWPCLITYLIAARPRHLLIVLSHVFSSFDPSS